MNQFVPFLADPSSARRKRGHEKLLAKYVKRCLARWFLLCHSESLSEGNQLEDGDHEVIGQVEHGLVEFLNVGGTT